MPDAEARFWAACHTALREATARSTIRLASVLEGLLMLLTSMEQGQLEWRCSLNPCPGEPRVALASHALNRDFQVKVALPLQCLALLRMRKVGAKRIGKGNARFRFRRLSSYTQ